MDPAERATLIQQALDYQREFMSVVFADDATSNWARLDLTMGQLRALVAVACSGPLPIGLLGTTLGLGKPAATLLVNALVRHELAERHEDPLDRRRTLVKISEGGQALLEELLRGRQILFAQWISKLADDDLSALARVMGAMVRIATTEHAQHQRFA